MRQQAPRRRRPTRMASSMDDATSGISKSSAALRPASCDGSKMLRAFPPTAASAGRWRATVTAPAPMIANLYLLVCHALPVVMHWPVGQVRNYRTALLHTR